MDHNQTENDYKYRFIAPLFKALFKNNKQIKKEWGGSSIGSTEVDGLISIVDEENVFTPLSIIEVSGPWHVLHDDHYSKDRNKMAKNLKMIMNYIHDSNVEGASNIRKIKLYGIQIYQKEFYVYSLQSICSGLYLFKEETVFSYPTSPCLFRSQLSEFIKDMLTVQSLIESSLKNVLAYINDIPS